MNPAQFLGLGPCAINGTSYNVCSTTSNTNHAAVVFAESVSGTILLANYRRQKCRHANVQRFALESSEADKPGRERSGNDAWSHCLSYPFDFTQGSGVNADQIRAFRSNCPTGDVRQVFNLSSVFQAPKFAGMMHKIAGGWQLSPIITARSGGWFSVTTGVDNALTGQPNQVPIQVGNPYLSKPTASSWINTAAFQAPAPGTLGNLQLNSVKGPGISNGTWRCRARSLSRKASTPSRCERKSSIFSTTRIFKIRFPQ